MAFQSVWHYTDIPEEMVNILVKDIEKFNENMGDSKLHGDAVNKDIRDSKNAWVPTHHWIGGFLWHYIERANRENYLFDLSNIDGESMQYTQYDVGQYYKWHSDSDLSTHYLPSTMGHRGVDVAQDFINKECELVRKLSFVFQLSDPSEYEGGQLQLLQEDGKPYFAPAKRGTMILFDSRTKHRVLKVTKGTRRSIVGWVVGPRWK